MQAEIIAIGSEFTSGERLDTNSQWLSAELEAVGIPVGWHTTIADDLPAMTDAFRIACERADLVLVTGGLGPTLDDLTRQALAELTGTPLVSHEPSLTAIREMFARRNRKMAERNTLQAMFPEGSEPLPNPLGTAPGIRIEVSRRDGSSRALLAALPGVPAEMKPMFRNQVLPRLNGSGRVIRRARIHCFGAGESDIEERLGELTARGREPEVGITASQATITLRIVARGDSAEECETKIESTRRTIRERLGALVFGEEDDELEHVVVRLLSARGLTLTTAESGTGGLLAHRLTESPGFEICYLGGVVAPTAAAQAEMLDVAPTRFAHETSRTDRRSVRSTNDATPLCEIAPGSPDPSSAEIARAMAESCRRRFGTDFALAVAACPTPNVAPHAAESSVSSEASTAPIAHVTHVALAGDGVLVSRGHALLHDPTLNRSRAAKMALDLLRRHLSKDA